ncbi:unnamed protein product [Schistosoma turkestanicum]|nr:unnamed protein product [Schistosoma turkestanicum]
MSKRKSCSTSLDPNATTTQHDANDADNHAEAKITTVQPSSLSDHTSQLSHNIVSSMSTVSMPIPTTSVNFVTSNDSYPVTMKSSLNDNDENIKKWSYSPVYSSIQTNTSTIMTTSTTHHHQPQQQQQSSNTSTTHTTFISNSKYHQSNIMKTNYEAIPTVVEPVEVAAGEAQAELNERDQQVLQSLLMNKSSTIVSSTPINNLSYTVTNTPMMTASATSMNSMSSSSVSLSSFNNSSSVAKMNKSNTESFNINSANNTTITTAPPIIPTTTIQEDQLPKPCLNENLVSSSTMPTSSINSNSSSSKLKTFPYSSSSQTTEMTSEQKIANSSLTNHSNHDETSLYFVQSTLDRTNVEKPISNGENVHLQTTSEYVSSVSGSSVKPVIAHSVSVIPIKNHVASSTNINDNDNNRRISNSHSIDHNIKSTTIGHSITNVQYSSQPSDETVTLDMNNNNNNISNHTKPTVNGFKPVVDDSAKITTTTSSSSPSSSMPTSDSFQSRIKPPSFTVKTSDLNKTSTPKITSVKADDPNHVIQNNSHNNNTMPNTFNTPESIKMSNKINSAESDNNSLSTPPVLCSASVSVTGIRPPSGIKAPSITPPDKIKSKIATNGHTNASAINTSITSAHDEEMVHTNKKHIPTITEQQPPSCELIKRQESTTDDSLEQYPSGLPKPSSVYGKVQSTKSRPLLGNSPVANSGIPAPSIMPSSSSMSGQSHMPVPTSIPLPSGIKPPSRSPKSALAK